MTAKKYLNLFFPVKRNKEVGAPGPPAPITLTGNSHFIFEEWMTFEGIKEDSQNIKKWNDGWIKEKILDK